MDQNLPFQQNLTAQPLGVLCCALPPIGFTIFDLWRLQFSARSTAFGLKSSGGLVPNTIKKLPVKGSQ
ncbi:MAG: hypothetical protein Q8Q85_14500 [Gemmatimonadales bacterium]|nr:hypothetical protein [Gemmatimonadales bacterium]